MYCTVFYGRPDTDYYWACDALATARDVRYGGRYGINNGYYPFPLNKSGQGEMERDERFHVGVSCGSELENLNVREREYLWSIDGECPGFQMGL